jgi:hypothetical protein
MKLASFGVKLLVHTKTESSDGAGRSGRGFSHTITTEAVFNTSEDSWIYVAPF